MALRHISRFDPALTGSPYTFSRYHYEWQSSSPLRMTYSELAGQSYAYNHVPGIPLRSVAREHVRFVLSAFETRAQLETEIDNMRSRLLLGAAGKLVMLNDDASERWATAQIAALPEMTFNYRPWQLVPIAADFVRLSDWQSESLTTVGAGTIVSPKEVSVINPGNIQQHQMVMRFRSNSAAGYTNVKVRNKTNGYIIETTLDAGGSNHEVKIDTSRPSLETSIDDGVNYTDAFSGLVIQPAPYKYPPLAFVLEPGGNLLEITSGGSVSMDFLISFYGAWA